MSDYPAAAVESVRRQLHMVLDFDEDLIDSLTDCQTPPEIRAIDRLDEDDADLLVRVNGRQNLDELFGMSDEDAQIILDMSNQIRLLGEAEYSDQRHEFLIRRVFHIAKSVGGLADAVEDREAAERIVAWINTEKNSSAETNKDYRTTLRVFGGLVTDGPVSDKPESIEWVPGGYPNGYDPAPDPADMFRWDDHIQPMLDACHNSRDRAVIAMAWDLGPRPGELYDLSVGDFVDHKFGLQVSIRGGKQGSRSAVLIPSVPYVRQWLDDHPAGDDPDAPLWTRKNRNSEISNQRIRDIFKEAAERSDITPPSSPTPAQMRKSSASYLASEGVSQAHLEDHHGWARGSDIASRYVSVFSEANDREIAAAHGREIEEEESQPLAPRECPRCGQETPRSQEFCVHCGQVVDPETMEILDNVLAFLDEQLVTESDPTEREQTLTARRTLEEKPHMMDRGELEEFAATLME